MDVEVAIGRLRVIRSFSDQPVAEEDVSAILEAARRAGSSKNLQRWQFIVVRDRDTLLLLARVGPYAGHLANAAVAIALVTPEGATPASARSIMWDLGRAAQNMVLIAWARGIGSAPATVYEHEMCRQILGYPDEQHCEYVLSFGYPANTTELRRPLRLGARRPLAEMVHRERW
jgi:nitroreductase